MPKLTRFGNWRINMDSVQAVETTGDAGGVVAAVYLNGFAVELKGEAARAILAFLFDGGTGGPSVTIIERGAA